MTRKLPPGVVRKITPRWRDRSPSERTASTLGHTLFKLVRRNDPKYRAACSCGWEAERWTSSSDLKDAKAEHLSTVMAHDAIEHRNAVKQAVREAGESLAPKTIADRVYKEAGDA